MCAERCWPRELTRTKRATYALPCPLYLPMLHVARSTDGTVDCEGRIHAPHLRGGEGAI